MRLFLSDWFFRRTVQDPLHLEQHANSDKAIQQSHLTRLVAYMLILLRIQLLNLFVVVNKFVHLLMQSIRSIKGVMKLRGALL